MMSVDVASLPSWKLALIERKKRQELESQNLGASKSESATGVPSWKQEILLRKQQKRFDGGKTFEDSDGEISRSLTDILLSPEDPKKRKADPWPILLSPVKDISYETDLKTSGRLNSRPVSFDEGSLHNDENCESVEERLPPVHQNPILLLDLEKRQQSSFTFGIHSPSGSDSQRNSFLSKLRVGSHQNFDGDAHSLVQSPVTEGERYDEVFQEEEVTYGKGFVSRLLQKFSYLSGREETLTSGLHFSRSLSRGQSSEDFSKHQLEPGIWSVRQARKKTNSLDDLLKEKTDNCHHLVVETVDHSRGDECVGWQYQKCVPSGVDGHVEGSIVLSAKSIFESLATSPTSTKNWVHTDWHSTIPQRHQHLETQSLVADQELPIKTSRGTSCTETLCAPNVQKFLEESCVGTTAHLPAIICPKPIYTAPLSSQAQLKKTIRVHRSEAFKFKEAHIKNSAQISSFRNSVSSTSVDDEHEVDGDLKETADARLSKCSSINEVSHLEDVGNNELHSGSSQQLPPDEGCSSVPQNSVSQPNPSSSGQPTRDVDKPQEPSCKETSTTQKKMPSRPGLLLIRPASNLTSIRTDYLQMTKYNDIKHGEFAPAKEPIRKGDGDDNDDLNDSDDAVDYPKYLKARYEFEGAGVCVGRSLLAKTKQGVQLKINFDDSATSTYEYPSEQSLMDSMPLDLEDVGGCCGEQDGGMPEDTGDSHSSSDLSSYKSKTLVDFAFGSNHTTFDKTAVSSTESQSADLVREVEEESSNAGTWSHSCSTDLLF